MMAVSSADAGNIQQTIDSLSGTISPAIQSLTRTMASAIPSAVVQANETAVAQVDTQGSWAWSLARIIIFLIKVFPGILFWIITFTTITLPTFLFTLLSTSLTVTMNATTLWVHILHITHNC
jgi:lysophospholipid hydrolase